MCWQGVRHHRRCCGTLRRRSYSRSTKFGPRRFSNLAVEGHNRSRSSCGYWRTRECFYVLSNSEMKRKYVHQHLRHSSHALLTLCLVHGVLGTCVDGGSDLSPPTTSRRCPCGRAAPRACRAVSCSSRLLSPVNGMQTRGHPSLGGSKRRSSECTCFPIACRGPRTYSVGWVSTNSDNADVLVISEGRGTSRSTKPMLKHEARCDWNVLQVDKSSVLKPGAACDGDLTRDQQSTVSRIPAFWQWKDATDRGRGASADSLESALRVFCKSRIN